MTHMPAGTSLLGSLMAPCTAEKFLAEYWPRRVFATHGPPERLPAMMRERMLSSAADLAASYRGRVMFSHGHSERMLQASDAMSLGLHDMGLTVSYLDIGNNVPGAQAFMRQLEAELGLHEGSISISAFSSPQSEGLPAHYDAQELISIQLLGSKRFRHAPMLEIANPYGMQYTGSGPPFDDLYPQATQGFPDSAGVSFDTTDMVPGSVLFLPRGTWHWTEASTDSLSLSVVIEPASALRCALEQIGNLLLQDPDWRQPFFGACSQGARHDEARTHAARLLAGLPDVIARLRPDDLLEAPARTARRLQRIAPATRFQRAPNGRIEIPPPGEDGTTTIALRLRQSASRTTTAAELRVAASALPVFHWIAGQTHAPFSAADLQAAFPAEAFDKLRGVLELCAKAQFLKLLWFAPLGIPREGARGEN